MSRHQNERRPSRNDAVSSVRAQMARAEVARLRTIKLAVGVAAVALLVVAALAVSIVGSGAARAAEPVSEVPVATSFPRTARTSDAEPAQTSTPSPDVQQLRIAIGVAGYEPSVLSANAGAPIELTVAKGEGCAAGFRIPSLGIEIDNSTADASRDLGTLGAGDYRFTCAMEMVEGVLQVR